MYWTGMIKCFRGLVISFLSLSFCARAKLILNNMKLVARSRARKGTLFLIALVFVSLLAGCEGNPGPDRSGDTIESAITAHSTLGVADETGLIVTINANEQGTLFWILYLAGDTPASDNGRAFAAAAKGETEGVKRSGEAGVPTTTDAPVDIFIDQLARGTAYDFFMVMENADGNTSMLSRKLSMTTMPERVLWDMAGAKWGISHHYLPLRYDIVADTNAWDRYVNDFDVDAYADLAEKLGAGWVILTVTHGYGFINVPSDLYDQHSPPCPSRYPNCVNQPGLNRADHTPTRDLMLDLSTALRRKGIATIAYFSPSISARWTEVDLTREDAHYDTIYPAWISNMIRNKSHAWGNNVIGWVFDGYYEEFRNPDRANNFAVARRMYTAAISGSPSAVVTFNTGIDRIDTEEIFSTFSTGEHRTLPPITSTAMVPGYGHTAQSPNLVQSHVWTFLTDNPTDVAYSSWGRIQFGMKYSNDDVAGRARAISDVGGVSTWDAAINPSGEWRVDLLVQTQAIGNRVGTTTDTTYSGLTLVNDDHADIQYAGDWTQSKERGADAYRQDPRVAQIDGVYYNGAYQQDAHITEIDGASFTYPFTGSSIVFATSKAPDQGDVEVYIDDVSQGTFSTHAAHRHVQVIIFEKHDLSAGAHTLKVVKQSGAVMVADVVLSKR